ncbi:hypothetical protein FO519_005244 [Halicephalobus sp. NKZ332]|nr:hypothetical protein FO519_005244 [Halicephalobus sp. NKZ332]
MSKLLEDDDYASSDDEDYVPTLAENTKADQELAALGKQENHEESGLKNGSDDDFVGRIQEFSGDIKATTVVPGLRYMVKTTSDFCGELVEEEKEMSKEELDDLVTKSASGGSRKRKALKVDGLDVALKSLEKKKKISLIDKTGLDWKNHVQKKGIETTLNTFEKSRKNIVDHLNFAKKTG